MNNSIKFKPNSKATIESDYQIFAHECLMLANLGYKKAWIFRETCNSTLEKQGITVTRLIVSPIDIACEKKWNPSLED